MAPMNDVSPDSPLVEYLRASAKILVFTGAGISTGSGIPDFRGPDGVWKRRQPVYYQDFMTSEAARIEHWDYKLEGWLAFRDACPNATHRAVVDLERAGKILMVVTQNIDGLHSKAGTSPDRLVEIHGTNSLRNANPVIGFRSGQHFQSFERRANRRSVPAAVSNRRPSAGQNLRAEDLRRADQAAEAATWSSPWIKPVGLSRGSDSVDRRETRSPYIVINRAQRSTMITLRCPPN